MNNLSKINEVIKASPAIQIQSKISLLQRRAWNVLLANAYNELVDKDIHCVSMVELAAKLGFRRWESRVPQGHVKVAGRVHGGMEHSRQRQQGRMGCSESLGRGAYQ